MEGRPMKIVNILLTLPLVTGFSLFSPIKAETSGIETATFAGGCFWCMTPPFEKLDGVLKVVAGYADGRESAPTYEDYAEKGFTEAVQITYDPAKITYSDLVDVFWKQINPTDPEGQFVDRGPQYRAAVYYHNKVQRKLAERSKLELEKSGRYDKPIVTPILPFKNFYAAENYHQDYYKKDPMRYNSYHSNSGRDEYLNAIWGAKKH
jgi:peptide methionine sulfoxide reductase msrA/msrB